jgi:hypothetical protein
LIGHRAIAVLLADKIGFLEQQPISDEQRQR